MLSGLSEGRRHSLQERSLDNGLTPGLAPQESAGLLGVMQQVGNTGVAGPEPVPYSDDC